MLDLNRNGVSDFKELGDWFKKMAFNIVDMDGDGEIEIEEIVESLARAGYAIVKLTK